MIIIVPMYQGALEFASEARKRPQSEWAVIWEQFVLEPYWDLWAAGQHNEARTRAEMSIPPKDLDSLETAATLLAQSEVEKLVRSAFESICSHLPYHDGDTAICVMAAGTNYREVVGTCIGSSTLLTIPAAQPGWQEQARYVLAHERHHSAWGYHYYYLSGGSRRDLLVSLISEGAADTFAHHLYPNQHAFWVEALTIEQEEQQWRIIQPLLDVPDRDGALHRRFFFGDEATGTPPSTGYTIGFHILQSYWRQHPDETVADWTCKAPEYVFAESGYSPCDDNPQG